ncbi:MAG: Gfo/Idh/MocA family oxidoreductase [candidate division KSB1 bacterium]|nr:Gfo/Idh/MocA family oxidoreductase [candidate division KSB1 bacterium]
MKTFSRRDFLTTAGAAAGSVMLSSPVHGSSRKKRIVLVGTGVRGTGFWGRNIVQQYSDLVEFVGLCDINPGRLKFARSFMGIDCSVYTDFDTMIRETNPDMVIVTTVDATHHQYIVKSLDLGLDVLTEKPMTTDERKCQEILDAERRSGKELIVGFNYRWAPYMTKIKDLLHKQSIGNVRTVDFHWYLNTYHGASYFRRWHGQREYSGTLWVHKATHHFDLLNWWIDSEPVEVFAYGDLEHYGSNHSFRGDKCRTCPHKEKCKFFWDITENEHYMNLYVANEKYDGYIRDNCLFRHEINIYDKMSAQIKYANGVIVNYSLTTYSPFEGWRTAFNGFDGRLEAWLDIPWISGASVDQAEMHAAEMDQGASAAEQYEPIIVHNNWQKHNVIKVPHSRGGHGGGDKRMQDRIFLDPNAPDPLGHAAGSRDGAMSILIGIAARKSIESGEAVRIAELTDLQPREKRL